MTHCSRRPESAKMWIGEAEKYRDHLLRLDADSRRNRFAGAVSRVRAQPTPTVVRIDPVIHGFLSTARCAAQPSCAPSGADHARGRSRRSRIESSGREPRRRLACCSSARCWPAQSRPQIPAHGVPRRQQRMQQLGRKLRSRAELRFLNVVGEVAAPRPTPFRSCRILADATARHRHARRKSRLFRAGVRSDCRVGKARSCAPCPPPRRARRARDRGPARVPTTAKQLRRQR